jgi:xanthine dehydrogenase accessory factor
MAVAEDGRVIGSISGGCIEGEAYELALATLASGRPTQADLGADASPFAAHLSCGGSVRVAAMRVGPSDAEVARALRAAVAGEAATVTLAAEGESFTFERAAPPRMIVVGAVDFSAALVDAARLVGFVVTVVDARGLFATAARFPTADAVVVAQPGIYLSEQRLTDRDAVCVLTHEDRFDVPAIAAALVGGAGYVGAMGSRGAQDRRVRALADAGVTDLSRLHAPIGLDLGGRTPAETAIAIVAEIVAERHSGTARPLRDVTGSIHHRVAAHAERPVS